MRDSVPDSRAETLLVCGLQTGLCRLLRAPKSRSSEWDCTVEFWIATSLLGSNAPPLVPGKIRWSHSTRHCDSIRRSRLPGGLLTVVGLANTSRLRVFLRGASRSRSDRITSGKFSQFGQLVTSLIVWDTSFLSWFCRRRFFCGLSSGLSVYRGRVPPVQYWLRFLSILRSRLCDAGISAETCLTYFASIFPNFCLSLHFWSGSRP